MAFWKKSGGDLGGRNLTRADVWNCDFSSFTGTGTYRLAVEGVGCSPDFTLSRERLLRAVQDLASAGSSTCGSARTRTSSPCRANRASSPARTRPNFKVYLTTYGPFHPDWKRRGGDQWDNRDWSQVQRARQPDQPQRLGRPFRRLRLGPQPRPHLDHLGPAAAVSPQQRQAQRRQLPDPRERQRHPRPHRRGPLRGRFLAAPARRQGRLLVRPEQPRRQGHGDVPGRRLPLHGLGQRRQRRHAGRLLPHRRQAGPGQEVPGCGPRGVEDRQRRGAGPHPRHRQRPDARARPEVHGGGVPLQRHRRHDLRGRDGQGVRHHRADLGDRQRQVQPVLGHGRRTCCAPRTSGGRSTTPSWWRT